MSADLLACPVNFEINCDWDRVRRIYNQLVEKKNQGYFDTEYEPSYFSNIHSINQYGAIITDSSRLLVDHEWNSWVGSFLEYILPSNVKELSSKMLDAKINFKNFGYFIHHGEIRGHIDAVPEHTMNSLPFENKTGRYCNLNYVISSTDPDAYTYVKDTKRDIEESYKSTVGKLFLLDVSSSHSVVNKGTREVFQLKILSPYDQVKEFLIKNNMIV